MKLNVVSATLDAVGMTMYLQDGTTHVLKQGHPQLARLVGEIFPVISTGEIAVVELHEDVDLVKKFAEMSDALVKFMTVTDERFKAIEEMLQRGAKAADIVTKSEIQTPDAGETVVAIIDTDEGTKALPGVEHIMDHMASAASKDDPIGVVNLIKKMAELKDKRKFSAEDLLKFLKTAHLQVADNGDIIAFKALNRHAEGGFVDIHSGTVRQDVGFKVFMDEALVDPSRSNDCSVGLHIASTGYLNTFKGQGCFIVQIPVSACIAVPQYSTTKMRVSEYVILHQLEDDQYRELMRTSDIFKVNGGHELMEKYMTGEHYSFTKTAFVQPGKKTEYTELTPLIEQQSKAAPKPKAPAKKAKVAKVSDMKKKEVALPVSVKQVAKANASEKDLSPEQKKALKLVREGKGTTEAQRITGINRRSIDRLIAKYGK